MMPRRPDRSGQTLIELLISVAIGGILSLAMASVFTFGVNQFNSLMEQNTAEESLLQTAYYLRFYLAQALKTRCVNFIPNSFTMSDDGTAPVGLAAGNFDCARYESTVPPTWPGAGILQPLAVF